MARWKVAGINFDHFHMGDNLRAAAEHPEVEIVGLCDAQPDRMEEAIAAFGIDRDKVFTDCDACLEQTKPDMVVLCPASAEHGDWTERVMAHGVHVLVEKPMAADLAEADRMVRAAEKSGKQLGINWPMAWMPTNRTAYRLIGEGRIGEVREVHYYDGNRGPLYHAADKKERTQAEVDAEKPNSWFYRRAAGGGSLLDYLGYGTTLGTWFNGGKVPIDVMAMVDQPEGLEVDEHCIAVARYAGGLSKFETRWGTFTDPWVTQPQPQCGFVIVGSEGTIGSFDYQPTIWLQTRSQPDRHEVPVDDLPLAETNGIAYMIDCLQRGEPLDGPLSPSISRIGQRIVDAAIASSESGQAVQL